MDSRFLGAINVLKRESDSFPYIERKECIFTHAKGNKLLQKSDFMNVKLVGGNRTTSFCVLGYSSLDKFY
jgi:hypothetical protein